MKLKFTAKELLQFEHYVFLKKSIADLEQKLLKHLKKITDAEGIYITTVKILPNCIVKDGELYQYDEYLGEACDNYFVNQSTVGEACDSFTGYIYFATAVKGTYIGFYYEM